MNYKEKQKIEEKLSYSCQLISHHMPLGEFILNASMALSLVEQMRMIRIYLNLPPLPQDIELLAIESNKAVNNLASGVYESNSSAFTRDLLSELQESKDIQHRSEYLVVDAIRLNYGELLIELSEDISHLKQEGHFSSRFFFNLLDCADLEERKASEGGISFSAKAWAETFVSIYSNAAKSLASKRSREAASKLRQLLMIYGDKTFGGFRVGSDERPFERQQEALDELRQSLTIFGGEGFGGFQKLSRNNPSMRRRNPSAKLGSVITVKSNDPNADFWVIRRGSAKQVGRPTRSFSPEAFGITVTNRDVLLPEYLYYVMESLWSAGHWHRIARGTLSLVHITKTDIENIPISTPPTSFGMNAPKVR